MTSCLADLSVSSFLTITFYRPTIPGTIPDVPRVYLDYGAVSPFNASKVALLVENRANPILAPLMLHFMSVVPPDWRFRFMGSKESVAAINSSVAIQHQVNIGKLDLTYIPTNMSTAGQELISRFLTNLWLYETVLQPAEWLLVFQTDSESLFTPLVPRKAVLCHEGSLTTQASSARIPDTRLTSFLSMTGLARLGIQLGDSAETAGSPCGVCRPSSTSFATKYASTTRNPRMSG